MFLLCTPGGFGGSDLDNFLGSLEARIRPDRPFVRGREQANAPKRAALTGVLVNYRSDRRLLAGPHTLRSLNDQSVVEPVRLQEGPAPVDRIPVNCRRRTESASLRWWRR